MGLISHRRRQSFAKNAGLYGERVGALHVVSVNPETADRVRSQLSVLQRSEISNPPSHGARLVALILQDPQLFSEWKQDISTMATRIIDMRHELHRLLTQELKTPGNWDHILNQIGMFRWVHVACVSVVCADRFALASLDSTRSRARPWLKRPMCI